MYWITIANHFLGIGLHSWISQLFFLVALFMHHCNQGNHCSIFLQLHIFVSSCLKGWSHSIQHLQSSLVKPLFWCSSLPYYHFQWIFVKIWDFNKLTVICEHSNVTLKQASIVISIMGWTFMTEFDSVENSTKRWVAWNDYLMQQRCS